MQAQKHLRPRKLQKSSLPWLKKCSNNFPDLYMLRTYYFQAEAAIENGRLYAPDQNLYVFSDYALQEMVMDAFGGFPVEAYFPAGFRTLLEHDQDSEVSYLETLSVFLEENMSYAKAARRLFLHRSTLIERIRTGGFSCRLS